MKKIIFCIMILGGLMSSPALADNYSFVTLEFPPLEFNQPDGKAGGVAIEIVQKIMTNLGHTVDVTVYPWARALSMVKTGSADAIFTAYKNPEREAFLYYSKNVLIPQVVGLYVKAGSPLAFNGDLATLKGKKIGVVNTISYGKTFDGMRDQLTVERTDKLELNFKKLKVDRIDMLVSNIYVADWTLKQMGLSGQFKRLPKEVESVDSFIAFSKAKGEGYAALRDAFDKELEKLIADGTYKAIMAKYGITQ